MGALDDKPSGVVSTDTSMQDEGEAMRRDPRFLGDPSQSMRFEGKRPDRNVSARQMNMSGHD